MATASEMIAELVTPVERFDPLSVFEEFWMAYPKVPNQSKTMARKSWGKLAQMDQLHAVNGLVGYKAFLASKPDHPACHAATWLNQRRWEGFVSGEGLPAKSISNAVRRPYSQTYAEVQAWRDKALADPMARTAALEGWLIGLIRHAEDHSALPGDDAQAVLKASWMPFLLSIKTAGSELSSWRRSMLSLAQGMLERGTELSRSIGVYDSAYERALARFHQFAERVSETKETPAVSEGGLLQSGV